MRLRYLASFLVLAAAGITSCESARAADPGVTDSEVVIGACFPLTGMLSQTGVEQKAGTEAAFDDVNRKGAIHGRRMKLLAEDGTHEPAKGAEITEKFIRDSKVFALMNYHGTANAKAVLPMVKAANIPFLFPRTGDSITRVPPSANVVNLRASYRDEANALIGEACGKRHQCRVAVLEQSDSFGQSAGTNIVAALGDRKLLLVGRAVVSRGATNMKAAFDELSKVNPEVVALGINAASATPFVKLVQEAGKNWTIIGFDNNSTLSEKLVGDAKTPILLAQVVPDPKGSTSLAAKTFRSALQRAGKETLATYISFEMYLNARVLAQALEAAGKDLTRDRLRAAFIDHDYQVDDLAIRFGADTSKGALPVHLVQLVGREWKPL